MRLFVLAGAALAGVGGCRYDCNGVHGFAFPGTEIDCFGTVQHAPLIYYYPNPAVEPTVESFVGDGDTGEFFLSRRPDLESLSVEVDDGEVVLLPVVGEDVEYDLVRNSLVFAGDPPAAEAAITVEYAAADASDP